MGTRYGFEVDGNNKMTAFQSYVKRLVFDSFAYNNSDFGSAAVKDFQFGEIMLYGRVNESNRPIRISGDSKLKRVKSSDGNSVLLVNFVADAFQAMTNKIKKDVGMGVIPRNLPVISNIAAKKGFEPLNKLYQQYNTDLYKAFKTYIDKYKLGKDIKNIDSYYVHYDQFQKLLMNLGFNCTRTGFVKSRRANPLMSGLVIDLEEYDYGDDAKKIEFIDSSHFNYYTQVALRHGFSVAKHQPMRLVADLASPYMRKFMEAYNLYLPTDVLLAYYTEAYVEGYENFKRDMITFYNQYAAAKPHIATYELCPKGSIINKRQRRRPVPHEKEFEIKGENFFLNKYIEIRDLEEGNKLDLAKREHMKKRTSDLLRVFDLNTALKYVETEFARLSTETNSVLGIRKRIKALDDSPVGD